MTGLSPITLQAYHDRLNRQMPPRLGQLRVRELSVGSLDRHLRDIADTHGLATARMCRSVLSGICTLAARHDALPQNPVRALGPVTGRARKAPRALTVPQLRQLRAALSYDDRALARDLPDLVGFLMATGLRIGEACDLAWNCVDLDAGTVAVRAAAVRVRGQGLVVKTTQTPAPAPWYCRVGPSEYCATGPHACTPPVPTAAATRSSPPHEAAGATPPTPRPTCATRSAVAGFDSHQKASTRGGLTWMSFSRSPVPPGYR